MKIPIVIGTLIALVLLAIPAQAARLDDLQTEYQRLAGEKADINAKMLRLQGAFAERQAAIAEQELPEPVETVEVEIAPEEALEETIIEE